MTPDPALVLVRVRCCILSLSLFLLTVSWGRAEQLEFIYVNANVGAAAGGHIALRLGNDVFHYQFHPNKRFLLIRESWDHFRLIYNRLRNRTVFSAVCEVESAAYRKIKDNFLRSLASQSFDLYREGVFKEQQALLDGLGEGRLTLTVKALGFFDRENGETPYGVMLREFVVEKLGKKFFSSQRKKAATRIETLLAFIGSGEQNHDTLFDSLIELGDINKRLAAIEVLEDALGLNPSALVRDPGGKKLTPEELHVLGNYLARQQQRVVNLLLSARPDSGEAILLQTGRCAAIMASIVSGSLMTLDPYPDNAISKEVNPADPEMMSYMVRLKDLYEQERDALLVQLAVAGASQSDLLYSMLENACGRLHELSAGIESGQPVRFAGELMTPSRTRVVREPVLCPPGSDVVLLQASLEQQRQKHEDTLAQKYYYKLLSRNCVNQLLSTINTSFANPPEAEKALGSWIEPAPGRVVTPHDLFSKVVRQYRVTEVTSYPSRRLAMVALLALTEQKPRLWLQEANTLTSTLYSPRSEDTPFLFFTDDVIWARPLLGAANFTWAAVHSVAGLFWLPTGDVEYLYQGVRGMFYSVPELFLSNIRKGTYLYDDLTVSESEL